MMVTQTEGVVTCRGCGKVIAPHAVHNCQGPFRKTPAKGEPMPQTIESWQKLYGLAEKAMLKDKGEISRLKQKINQLEQRK